MPVLALYEFNDTDTTVRDSALGNGAQDGLYWQGASASGGRLCKQENRPSAPLRARFAPLRLQNNNIITNTTPTPITNHLIVMF